MIPGFPGSAVRWVAGPLRFELASDDPAVRKLAADVFRQWATTDGGEPSRSWRVERLNDRQARSEWRVRSSLGLEMVVPSVERAVGAVEFGAVGAILESRTTIVHGALIAWDGRGVLLVGRGESGKSTLACALWERGATLLGDDVALIDPVSGVARPAPRRVSLRETSRALLGDGFFAKVLRGPSSASRQDGYLFHPDEIEPRPRPDSVRLVAAVFLARRGAAVPPARHEPIPPAHALLAFFPYTNLSSRCTPGEAIQILAPLANRVPAFDLGRGPLVEMATIVEGLARAGSPA